jgi:hypothetical protein
VLLILLPGPAAAGPYTFTEIANTTDPIGFHDFLQPPSINDNGEVAFYARMAPLGTADVIFRGSGGPLTEIVRTTPGGVSPLQFTPPSINNTGTVAFVGARPQQFVPGGVAGYFTGSGGPLTEIHV